MTIEKGCLVRWSFCVCDDG